MVKRIATFFNRCILHLLTSILKLAVGMDVAADVEAVIKDDDAA